MVRKLALIIVFLGLAVVLLMAVRLGSFSAIDDAFISFRYAENFAAGHGLVFNIGEKVEGYSSTLFVLILSAFAKVLGRVRLGALAVGVLSHAALVALLISFLARFSSERLRTPLSVAGIAFLMFHPSVFAYASSGMETTLAAALLLSAIYAATAAGEKEGGRLQAAGCGVLLLAAALTRPEMILLAAPFTLWLFFAKPDRRLARVMAPMLIVAIGYGAFLLWRHAYFGQWQPNTYYAKTAGAGISLVPTGLMYVFDFANTTLIPYLLLALVGGVIMTRAKLPTWWWGTLGVVATQIVAVVYVGGDHFPLGRFLVPTIAPMLLLLVEGVRVLRDTMNRTNPNLAAMRLRPALWVLVVLLLPLSFALAMFYKNAGINFVRNGAQAAGWCELGQSMAGTSPPDTSAALIAIGAFGYCSGMPIVDLVGLTDPVIAKTPTDLSKSAPGHGRFNSRYVLQEKKPDYIFLQLRRVAVPVPEWVLRRGIVHLAGRNLVADKFFQEEYAFHRLAQYQGFVHYWSRREFESEDSNPGEYPVEGIKPEFPIHEPPTGIKRSDYFEDDNKRPAETQVPEGWEVW
ncbi:MAG: hypothetical protein P9L99_10120 [Candidatus Lernaella stagnicola]|nr:hypothetical protein [Candidatus Lernaella stagnicola]